MKRFACILVAAGVMSPISLVAAEAPPTDKGVTSTTGINGNNNNAAAPTDAKVDQEFVSEAASGGMLEVQLGQLIQQRGQNDTAKNFGKMMVEDHSKANEQLMALATQKSITVSKQLSSKDQATLEKMQKMSGSDLDRAYMTGMVEDHKHDIAAFQKEAESGQDKDIKAFAQQTLPILQTHLQHAEKGVAMMKSDRTDTAQPAAGKQTPDNQGTGATTPRPGTSTPKTGDNPNVAPVTPNNQGTPGTSTPSK